MTKRNSSDPIRVVVVDDSTTARELLVTLLQNADGIQVVGAASNGAQAIRLTKRLRPDVVTMDVFMPGMDGLEATRHIMREVPTPIVIVTATLMRDDMDLTFEALRAGALTALRKPSLADPETCAQVVQTVGTDHRPGRGQLRGLWDAPRGNRPQRRGPGALAESDRGGTQPPGTKAQVKFFEPAPRSWYAAWAVAIALAWATVVLGLAACSSPGTLPTLVPTIALPTPLVTAVPSPSPTNSLPIPASAQIISYDLDPATGQMVPADRLSGAVAQQSDQLWVVTDNALVEYHRQTDDDLVAYKVITYTYDDIGRRVGWIITWPQGPTTTQRLAFLYEGLVAVGERLEVGGVVTTTYYPWATRDRGTTMDVADFSSAPITDVTRYDARCQEAAGMDCVTMVAQIIVSEASVGNQEEQRAVAWTFRNRLDRGLSLLSYAMDRTPNSEHYFELARQVLTAPADADVTKGATHFFSPRSMPRQGEEGRCKAKGGVYDCQGGLVFVEGLDVPTYAPFWHLLYEWLPVPGIRKTHFLFYRIPPIRPRAGSE